ncbi:MAG: cation:proton antiporter [Gemmatimonadota bacterium]
MNADTLPVEVLHLILLFTLFVLPRMLQRFRLPMAVTSVGIGAGLGLGLGWFERDPTVHLLATFGIVSLFLFAGLEVQFEELRQEWRVLLQHIVIGLAALGLGALGLVWALDLDWRPATLLSLALLTPSTGFILDAMPGWGLGEQERFWVKSKAIATELVALGAMFVVLQSRSLSGLGLASGALIALVAILPLIFRWFARVILPYAPKSEFAFLLMVAVLAATITRRLGVYYLVGAFVVGVAAQRFRARLPAMASDQMLHAVEVFASVFVPFYFFTAGLGLRAEDFTVAALGLGAGFLLLVTPFRIGLVAGHRRLVLGEPIRRGSRVGLAMVPTLVFGLVIAEILRDSYGISSAVFGGLIIYTLANTLLPGLLLSGPQSVAAPAGAGAADSTIAAAGA